MKHQRIPIACSLPSTQAESRTLDVHDIMAQARSTERIESGVLVTLDPGLAGDIAALIEQEAECCSFLSMSTETSTDELRLSVTTDDEHALPAIEAFLGVEPRP